MADSVRVGGARIAVIVWGPDTLKLHGEDASVVCSGMPPEMQVRNHSAAYRGTVDGARRRMDDLVGEVLQYLPATLRMEFLHSPDGKAWTERVKNRQPAEPEKIPLNLFPEK